MASSLGVKYRAFFQPLVDALNEKGLVGRSTAWARPFQLFPSGYDGVSYGCVFMAVGDRRFASVYLWIKGDDRFAVFDALEQSKAEIESELGAAMWWNRKDKDASHMGVERDGCAISDSDEELDAAREWMLYWFPRLREVMEPRLNAITTENHP